MSDVAARGSAVRQPAQRRFQIIVIAAVVLTTASGLGILAAGGSSNSVTLKGIGDGPVAPGPSGTGVTNGGVAGTGHFTVAGAINDAGTYTDYRTVADHVATIRKVLVTGNGSITIVVTIRLGSEAHPPWTITYGTGRYAGLHGKGRLTVDNYMDNPYS
jgi:hypothetical protein